MVDTVLVPLTLPDPEPPSPVLVEDLATMNVVLLGHYPVPEQTPRDAAREQFGDEAQAELDAIAETFADAGASVTTRLVFGMGRSPAIDRVMVEEDCVAEWTLTPTDGIDHILVPIPAVAEFDRLPRFIRALCEETTKEITLFHVVEGDATREEGERIVAETREGLLEGGFDPDLVNTRVVEGSSHDAEILRAAAEYDAVVMYEAAPRIRDHVFGTLPDRIADETGDPVVVVRRDYDD